VYSINPAREIIKTPKLFFQDNGLLNTLAEIGSGVQFENSVFNQLKHHGKLNYYSLKTGREIDFILDNKIAMEVKEHAGDFDIKRLNRLSSNISIKNNYMIFRYAPPNDFSSGTNFIWGGDIL
jgi:predicted AAA+ superfamily ATPase